MAELTAEDIQSMIDKSNAEKDDKIAALQERLDAAETRAAEAEAKANATVQGPPLTLVPYDAGGPGLDVAETWSQAEQEAIRAGR